MSRDVIDDTILIMRLPSILSDERRRASASRAKNKHQTSPYSRHASLSSFRPSVRRQASARLARENSQNAAHTSKQCAGINLRNIASRLGGPRRIAIDEPFDKHISLRRQHRLHNTLAAMRSAACGLMKRQCDFDEIAFFSFRDLGFAAIATLRGLARK